MPDGVVIVDAFLWNGEQDMLDLRRLTLAPVVDAHIAVVCTRTHQGQMNDLPLIDSRWVDDRPPLYVHLFEPDMTGWPEGSRGGVGTAEYQRIEKHHRDYCRDAVFTITDAPDTIVMVSDVDEIPNPAVVEQLGTDLGQVMFQTCAWWTMAQRFHSTSLNLLHPQQPWFGTCVSRLEDLAPQAMRDARTTVDNPEPTCGVIEHAGVHLSWFGTDDERSRKLSTFSHAELAHVDLAQQRHDGLHVNGEQLVRCEFPDPSMWWPAPLLDGTFLIPEAWLS